jgi:hypothetical protein
MQITINAHAKLEDIYEWLTPFTEKMPLYFALEVYFPKFRLHPLARWSDFVQKTQKLKANELWIDLVPIPAMRGTIDLKYNNRERFSINLPELRKTGLREANFGTVATKEKHLKVWRAIIRAIRKQTTRGMWIWNDIHHKKAFSKRHGFSARVAEQHAQGLELLPFAGGNRLFIAEPDSASGST